MKNSKKIICLILTLVLMTSSMSAFAFGNLDYKVPFEYMEPKQYDYMDSLYKFDVGEFVEKDKESEAEKVVTEDTLRFELLTTFGIWDDPSVKPEALVNITDFSVIVARTRLGVKNAFEGVYEYNSNENFATYRDLLKYFLEGLGYYQRCAEFNYSDESLLIVAQQIGLIGKGVDVPSVKSIVTRSALAKIVERALTMDLCEMAYAPSGYTYKVIEGKNLLNSVHGIYDVSGFVNAVPGATLYGNGKVRNGHVEIDRQDILTGNFEIFDYLGKQITAYARLDENSGLYTLIAISENEECESIMLDLSTITNISGSCIEYIDEKGDEQEIDVSSVVNVIQNTDRLNSITDVSDFADSDGTILLSSSSKDGDFDCAVIWKYDYLVVLANSLVEDKIFLDFNIKYNGQSYIGRTENGIEQVYVNGKTATWDDIASGHIIRVVRSSDNYYTQIKAITSSNISSIVSQAYDDVYVIDDVEYKVSNNLKKYINLCKIDPTIDTEKKLDEIGVGTKATFYTFDKYIVAYKIGHSYSYGYLRSVKLSKSALDPDCTLKIFASNSEWYEYPLAEKLTFDGREGVKKADVIETMKANSSIINDLVRYQLNSEEKIVALDTIIESSYELNDTLRVTKPLTGHEWTGRVESWNPYFLSESSYRTDDNTVVFKLPEDLDYEEGYMAGKNMLVADVSSTLKLYSPNNFNIVKAMIGTAAAADSVSGDATLIYVEKIVNVVLNADKMEYGYKIYASEIKDLRQRAMGDIIPRTFTLKQKEFELNPLVVGNIYSIPASANNLSSRSLNMTEAEFPRGEEYYVKSQNTYLLEGYGEILDIDYINQYVKIKTYDEGTEIIRVGVPRTKCIIDTTTKKVIKLGLADFAPGDKIFFSDSYGHTSYIIKFKYAE